ncbi:MAG: hypothetical protein WCX17_03220 [Parcubacteria group bacterium]|jgi:hypothetical protein
MVKKEKVSGFAVDGDNLERLAKLKERMNGGEKKRAETSSIGAALAGFEFPESMVKEYTKDYKDKKGLETLKKYQQRINAELDKIEKNKENVDRNQFAVDFFNMMGNSVPKKLLEVFVKNLENPSVEVASGLAAKSEQNETTEFEAALEIIKTLQKSKIERIKKGELTEKERQNTRLLLIGVKNRYLDNDGVNANIDWNSITPEEDSKIVEAQDTANKKIIAAYEEFEKGKIKKEAGEAKNEGKAKEASEKIYITKLEEMLEGIDSQAALINFCEENKKAALVSGDGTHHFLPSGNRLKEIFSGKMDWHKLPIISLRKKITEIMRAKINEPAEGVAKNTPQPSVENSPAILKENSNEKKLTQAEFEQKYEDILGVNLSDEKEENRMYVYSDGYNERTGQTKIFLQKGSDKGSSKRCSLDELNELLKIYTKRKMEVEKKTPKKSEKKITPAGSIKKHNTPKQKDVDVFEASLKTNGNRRVYDADSTPDDAKEARMKKKNLKKMEGRKAKGVESEKEKEMNSEARAFVEASAGEGKKWKEFLESEKGRALFGGDEKILREKVESFVSGGLKWYADFSEKDKKFAVEETMKKIFS